MKPSVDRVWKKSFEVAAGAGKASPARSVAAMMRSKKSGKSTEIASNGLLATALLNDESEDSQACLPIHPSSQATTPATRFTSSP
jgi:hypothetical protein